MAKRSSTYRSLKDSEVSRFFRWWAQRAEGGNFSCLRIWWRDDEPDRVSVYFEHNHPVRPNYFS